MEVRSKLSHSLGIAQDLVEEISSAKLVAPFDAIITRFGDEFSVILTSLTKMGCVMESKAIPERASAELGAVCDDLDLFSKILFSGPLKPRLSGNQWKEATMLTRLRRAKLIRLRLTKVWSMIDGSEGRRGRVDSIGLRLLPDPGGYISDQWVPRKSQLAQLDAVVEKSFSRTHDHLAPVVWIYGDEGSGKSSLALRYALDQSHFYGVFFFALGNFSRLNDTLVLFDTLALRGNGNGDLTHRIYKGTSSPSIDRRWLVILDGLREVEDLQKVNCFGASVTVLVTTRLDPVGNEQECPFDIKSIFVPGLTDDQAIDFLHQRISDKVAVSSLLRKSYGNVRLLGVVSRLLDYNILDELVVSNLIYDGNRRLNSSFLWDVATRAYLGGKSLEEGNLIVYVAIIVSCLQNPHLDYIPLYVFFLMVNNIGAGLEKGAYLFLQMCEELGLLCRIVSPIVSSDGKVWEIGQSCEWDVLHVNSSQKDYFKSLMVADSSGFLPKAHLAFFKSFENQEDCNLWSETTDAYFLHSFVYHLDGLNSNDHISLQLFYDGGFHLRVFCTDPDLYKKFIESVNANFVGDHRLLAQNILDTVTRNETENTESLFFNLCLFLNPHGSTVITRNADNLLHEMDRFLKRNTAFYVVPKFNWVVGLENGAVQCNNFPKVSETSKCIIENDEWYYLDANVIPFRIEPIGRTMSGQVLSADLSLNGNYMAVVVHEQNAKDNVVYLCDTDSQRVQRQGRTGFAQIRSVSSRTGRFVTLFDHPFIAASVNVESQLIDLYSNECRCLNGLNCRISSDERWVLLWEKKGFWLVLAEKFLSQKSESEKSKKLVLTGSRIFEIYDCAICSKPVKMIAITLSLQSNTTMLYTYDDDGYVLLISKISGTCVGLYSGLLITTELCYDYARDAVVKKYSKEAPEILYPKGRVREDFIDFIVFSPDLHLLGSQEGSMSRFEFCQCEMFLGRWTLHRIEIFDRYELLVDRRRPSKVICPGDCLNPSDRFSITRCFVCNRYFAIETSDQALIIGNVLSDQFVRLRIPFQAAMSFSTDSKYFFLFGASRVHKLDIERMSESWEWMDSLESLFEEELTFVEWEVVSVDGVSILPPASDFLGLIQSPVHSLAVVFSDGVTGLSTVEHPDQAYVTFPTGEGVFDGSNPFSYLTSTQFSDDVILFSCCSPKSFLRGKSVDDSDTLVGMSLFAGSGASSLSFGRLLGKSPTNPGLSIHPDVIVIRDRRLIVALGANRRSIHVVSVSGREVVIPLPFAADSIFLLEDDKTKKVMICYLDMFFQISIECQQL